MLAAKVVLTGEGNPRLERPARAEAELDVNGRMLHGRVDAATMPEAIDELAARLERQLRSFADRRTRLQQRSPELEPGEWHHTDWAPPRPPGSPLPVEDRAIVRREAYALGAADPLEALADLLDLDEDFKLFTDTRTGTEAVVHRRDDGRIGLIYPPGVQPALAIHNGFVPETSPVAEPISLAGAIAEMDARGHRFLFFVDAETGRGNVIYVRYDGNYGLIQPAT